MKKQFVTLLVDTATGFIKIIVASPFLLLGIGVLGVVAKAAYRVFMFTWNLL